MPAPKIADSRFPPRKTSGPSPAGGVAGRVDGRAVLVGKPKFLESEKVIIPEATRERAHALQAEGKTVLFAAIDGRIAGLLAVADPIKATTADAVADVQRLGIKLVMATGDNRQTAEAVAKNSASTASKRKWSRRGRFDSSSR